MLMPSTVTCKQAAPVRELPEVTWTNQLGNCRSMKHMHELSHSTEKQEMKHGSASPGHDSVRIALREMLKGKP
jgi:hypothetical protein